MIHPDALARHFHAHHEEFAIANLFDEAFDITYGAQDSGGLSYWLASPTPNAAERFGFQRELVVIYSPYGTTDARVLRLFERVRGMADFRNRVDPSVGIVVHNGDPDALSRIISQTQSDVLVPLLADDIKKKRGAGFIRASIASALGGVDPFAMSSPISVDRNFFGRRDITHSLQARANSGQNSGLFGLRKTGKTSVLFAVMRRLADQGIPSVHIDCQSPGVHFRRWWQLLEHIVSELDQHLRRDFRRNTKVRLHYDSENAATRFRDDIHALLTNGDTQRLVILLDEIEHITPYISGRLSMNWDDDFIPFWQSVRAVHQETRGRLVFVVAGVNAAAVETVSFGASQNPIFEVAPPHYLEPFDTDSVREMVRTVGRYGGVQFDEQAIRYIDHAYGGHPYLIRLACSVVWQRVGHSASALARIREDDFMSAESAIVDRLRAPIRDILLSLVWWYPDDYDTLHIIADGDAAFAREYSDESSVLGYYARVNLLHPDSESFRIDAIRQFLITNGDAYRNAVSPLKRADLELDSVPELIESAGLIELFEKRTEVEVRMRRAIISFFNVHFGYDTARVARAIVDNIPKGGGRPDPQQLFVGRKVEDAIEDLYFDDLRLIVDKNWSVFAPLFDERKDRFDMNMETANQARRKDGHAKLGGDREDFLNSLEWLLARLRRITD